MGWSGDVEEDRAEVVMGERGYGHIGPCRSVDNRRLESGEP